MKSSPFFLCALASTVLPCILSQATPGKDVAPVIDGRNLEAFEVAAKNIRDQERMPDHWRKIENYSVAFEGEQDGNFVMHFVPHWTKAATYLDFSQKDGLPVRIYVRKKDLKFLKGVVE
jgi:hypothetical protein